MKKEKIEELRMKIATLQVDIDKNEKSQQYNDSLEQELLQELNETRDFTRRQEITDKIATLRAMRKKLENKDLIEQLQDIKAQIQAEMNQCQQKIEAKKQKIGEIEQKNAKLQEDEKRYIAEIQENENIMELKKGKPSSKIYQSASEENKSLLQTKRGKISAMKRNDKKIKELANEISDLENTYAEFDKVLSEIEGRKQEKTEQLEKDETLDKTTDLTDTLEQTEEVTVENPEITQTVNENPGHGLKSNSGTISTSVELYNEIKKEGFYIDDNGTPIYYALITKADGNEELYKNEGFEQIILFDSNREEDLKNKKLESVGKYYDFGLVNILGEVDKKYSTKGLILYENMMRTLDYSLNAHLKPYATLDIEYDFSNLYKQPIDKGEKEKLKYLKKFANESNKMGLVDYQKEPNFLKRLWRKLTTKLLTTKTQEIQEDKLDRPLNREQILNDYVQLHDEPGFDIEMFVEGMSEEEANKYRNLQSQYEKGHNKFKTSLKVEKEKMTTEREISEFVNEFLQENNSAKEEKSL